MLPDFRNNIAFRTVRRLRSFGLLDITSNMHMKNITRHGCNDADRRKWKYTEKTLSQRHFVHHKFRMG